MLEHRNHRLMWARIALLSLFLLAIAAFYLSGWHRELDWQRLKSRIDESKALADRHFPISLLVFGAVYVVVAALALPITVVFSLLAGLFFGRWLGSLVAASAATIGASVAFLGCRFVVREWVERRFGRRLARVQRGVERDGAYYLITLRLIPLVPFTLVNLGMALTRMKLSTFALVTFFSMLPVTFLFTNAGTEIAKIEKPSDILSGPVLISLSLIGFVPLLIRLVVRRFVRPVEEPEE